MNVKVVLTLILLSITSYKVCAINVTYIADTNRYTPFWQNVHDIAHAAAQDLDINLTFIQGKGHRLLQDKIIEKIVNAENKPDLLIFMAHQRSAFKNFTLLEQAKIPFVTLSNFSYNDNSIHQEKIAYPQEEFKYWLGEHYDNHFQGAYLLMDYLISRSKQSKPKNTLIKALSINGDFASQSLEKSAGLTHKINSDEQTIIVQDIVAQWDYAKAKSHFKSLYQRHKGIDIVLAASDHMAVAAIEGAKELGLKPNKDIFIGGFDWERRAFREIKQEQLTASAGGHIFSAAWLLVKVYDHFHNKVVFHPGVQSPSTEFSLININNLNSMEEITYQNNFSHLNFYCFSRTFTQQKDYNFSINDLIVQLSKQSNHSCH
ncbi:ABC transporter substrate-binding protein [Litorilituus lipolyticus]|uniref:Periplasmic binding protein domain-containing protein n=1 Tax=Litorilituus lipolyticus TaxID=2491017 RepID=A0A502KVC7_9GAMM|nr:ABC transporter substrate-binding protein [Litorilituus lipolyticus]TPH12207.1 hypothetical protein EPA86_17850 [Litorilituus lipolyticus]